VCEGGHCVCEPELRHAAMTRHLERSCLASGERANEVEHLANAIQPRAGSEAAQRCCGKALSEQGGSAAAQRCCGVANPVPVPRLLPLQWHSGPQFERLAADVGRRRDGDRIDAEQRSLLVKVGEPSHDLSTTRTRSQHGAQHGAHPYESSTGWGPQGGVHRVGSTGWGPHGGVHTVGSTRWGERRSAEIVRR
jgi:hypothetical protein